MALISRRSPSLVLALMTPIAARMRERRNPSILGRCGFPRPPAGLDKARQRLKNPLFSPMRLDPDEHDEGTHYPDVRGDIAAIEAERNVAVLRLADLEVSHNDVLRDGSDDDAEAHQSEVAPMRP